MSKLTVFVAKEIITMNASMPRATAVAVRDDRIVEVGTLDTLQPYLWHACGSCINISEAEAGNRHQIDYANGRFYENGLSYAINRLNPYLLEPKRYREGLRRLAEVVNEAEMAGFAECLGAEKMRISLKK